MDRLAAMRLFVRIAQLGSFSRAATSLGIASATATERMRALEGELKAKLLHRTTRRLSLTEEGQRYLKVCRNVLEELEDVERSIGDDNQQRRGRVTVSVNVGLFRGILLPRLAVFAERHPEIRLQLITSDQRAEFVRDGIDFAVRVGGLEDQDLIVRRLGAPRRVTIASPDYVRRHGAPTTPDDLHRHRTVEFLLPQAGRMLEWEFLDDTVKRQIVFNGPLALNDAEGRVQLAEQGLGVAQTVCFLASPAIAAGRLVRLLPEWEAAAPPISLLYPRNRFLPARVRAAMAFTTDAVLEALRESARELDRQRHRRGLRN